ncbi:MAG: hypothetical protein POELPBGB_03089 [Bacteroidia bacterium]|nr:hypothetical protein [Bacteroidia bacterium]
MIKKLLLSVFIVAALAGCNKDKYVVEYVVDCNTCTISYWDENSAFVERIPSTGNWTYSFEATQENKISVAAQSQLCLDTAACADSLQLLADSVYVSVKVDGKVQESASAGNAEFSAAWVEIFLE